MHYRAQSHSAGYDSTQHCCDGSAVYPQCRDCLLYTSVVALLFIAHGNTSFGSLAPIIPYRSCKHYLDSVVNK